MTARTSPARIVFLLPDLGGGGAQQVMLALARALDRDRFAPHLLAIGAADALAAAAPDDAPLEERRAPRLIAGLPWAIRRIRALRPAAVIATPAYVNFALLAMRTLLPAKTLLIVREANTLDASLRSLPAMLRRAAPYRRLYPHADVVLAQSDAQRAALADAAPGARIMRLNNPVDVDRLRRGAQPPARRPGVGLRLLAAGRLTAQKGFDRLPAVFASLPPDATLELFGDGPDRAALQAVFAQAGLAERVAMRPFSADLPAWIAGADALIMTSRWEGVPNVALEALALGTPVFALGRAAFHNDLTSAVAYAADEPTLAQAVRATPLSETIDAPRSPLLPDEFALETVIRDFERILLNEFT